MIELDSTPISKDLFWTEVFWWLECLCKVNLFVQQENPFEIGCGNRVYLFHDPAFVFRNFRKFTPTLERWIPETPAAKNFSSLFKVFGVGARQAPLPQNLCFVCLPTVASHLLGEDWFWSAKGTTPLQIWMNFRKVFQLGVTSNPKVVIVDCWCSKWAFDHDLWEKMQEGSYPWGATWVINAWQSANITIITTLHSNVTNVATEIAIPIQFPSHPSWTLESFLSNFELQDLQGLTHGVALDHPGHFEKSYYFQFNLA